MIDTMPTRLASNPIAMTNESKNDLKSRWIFILRHKASEYEHPERKDGKEVTSPDLDDIANEIEAFFTGLNP